MTIKRLLLVGNFLSSHSGTRSVGEELSYHLAKQGWSTIETSSQPVRFLRFLDMLFCVISNQNKYRIAYVEVYSGAAFLWAEIIVHLLALWRKSVVLDLHGGRMVEFAKQYPARVARLLQLGRKVVTPSKFLQRGLAPYCSEIGYLPNALNISCYPFQIRNKPEPKLIWLRAFDKIYRPEMAVRVLALVKQEFATSKLTMIGPDQKDGSLASALRLAEELDVSSDLEIVGPVPKTEVPAWLARGDIFLNTTRYESFGVSVLEAALTGLPIVTTSVGELPYLWKNGESAMLVPENDSEAMARAVKRILTEPGLARRLSLTARNKAEKFDWAMILPQWEKLFQDLLLD